MQEVNRVLIRSKLINNDGLERSVYLPGVANILGPKNETETSF